MAGAAGTYTVYDSTFKIKIKEATQGQREDNSRADG
jgi:hypothetical protein